MAKRLGAPPPSEADAWKLYDKLEMGDDVVPSLYSILLFSNSVKRLFELNYEDINCLAPSSKC